MDSCIYHCTKKQLPFSPLNTESYHALTEIGHWGTHKIFSKPGIFAWDRFDEGSQLLLQHLPAFLAEERHAGKTAIDLGCGNGLLTIALLDAGCNVVATDNNAAALQACAHNVEHNGFRAYVRVIADDCAMHISEQFDFIVSNPPFHQGFDVEYDLTSRFLQATQRLLRPQAHALFVVNSFIPLERKARGMFNHVETVIDNKRFKLVQLQT
jgi:16S rRNA (guanine1207-N2)-methyltransferase